MADQKLSIYAEEGKEIWKPVKGYEELYEVSTKNRVKSLERFRENGSGGYIQKESILTPTIGNRGYWMVMLTKNKRGVPRLLHRLKAVAFLPNPENKKFINHKNGNKLDLRLCNLEWCTHAENMAHAFDEGLANNSGSENGQAKLTESDVIKMRSLYKTGNYTQQELGDKFGVSQGRACNIINRKDWTHI